MKREGDDIIIPVKAVIAIAGALVSGGGLGAYGVTQANAAQNETITQQLKDLKYELCELRNDLLESQGKAIRSCQR